jgi:hypothetical protein
VFAASAAVTSKSVLQAVEIRTDQMIWVDLGDLWANFWVGGRALRLCVLI